MDKFEDRKVIVTGATRGIGAAITSHFLKNGAEVFGIFGGNEDAAKTFNESLGPLNSRLSLHKCDVADSDQVKQLFDSIEKKCDSIDVLINNAGIRKDGVLALLDQKDWQSVIDVNLTGTYLMSKYAVLLMMKQKYGRIINITSPASYLGFVGQSNYAASKAGQIGLTKSLAKETAKKKITVNCVSPGFIDTDFIADLNDALKVEYKKLVPMKRFGKPEEVAMAVDFLASESASYITGTVLEVTGGL